MVASGGGHHQIGGHTVESVAFMKTNTKNGNVVWGCFPFKQQKRCKISLAPFHNSIISHIILTFSDNFHRFLSFCHQHDCSIRLHLCSKETQILYGRFYIQTPWQCQIQSSTLLLFHHKMGMVSILFLPSYTPIQNNLFPDASMIRLCMAIKDSNAFPCIL